MVFCDRAFFYKFLYNLFGYGPEYVENIFSHSLRKTSHSRRKLPQIKCLLFNFWMIKLTKTPILH